MRRVAGVTLIFLVCTVTQVAFSQTIVHSANASSGLFVESSMAESAETAKKKSGKSSNSEAPSEASPGAVSVNVSTKESALSGESRIIIPTFGDVGYLHLGLGAKAKANNSVASIFNEGEVVGGGEANFLIGYKIIAVRENNNQDDQSAVDTFFEGVRNPGWNPEKVLRGVEKAGSLSAHWFFLNPSVEGRKLVLATPDTLFEEQLDKEHNTLWTIRGGYNYWDANLFGFNTILGLSGALKRSDNFSSLNEVAITDQWKSEGDESSRSITRKSIGYTGDYEVFYNQDIAIEMFISPHKMPSVGLYSSLQRTFAHGSNDRTDLSFGLFFSKEKRQMSPSFGVVATLRDVRSELEEDNPITKNNFTVGLVASLKLGAAFLSM